MLKKIRKFIQEKSRDFNQCIGSETDNIINKFANIILQKKTSIGDP